MDLLILAVCAEFVGELFRGGGGCDGVRGQVLRHTRISCTTTDNMQYWLRAVELNMQYWLRAVELKVSHSV
jgi:hypothetical protein